MRLSGATDGTTHAAVALAARLGKSAGQWSGFLTQLLDSAVDDVVLAASVAKGGRALQAELDGLNALTDLGIATR